MDDSRSPHLSYKSKDFYAELWPAIEQVVQAKQIHDSDFTPCTAGLEDLAFYSSLAKITLVSPKD